MGRSFNDEKAGDQKRSRGLFLLLTAGVMMGSRGFKLIKNARSSNGFDAWRQLIMEYEPRLLNTTFKAGAGHREAIEAWGREVTEYQEQAENILPESIKANALVQGQEDEVPKSHL
eukprot:7728065-Pyramimonas_sp.AAC.1